MSATIDGDTDDRPPAAAATDMNAVLRRRPPTAEATAEADPPAVPSFDGGARDAPAAGTDMNQILRRQLRGRG